MAVLNAWAIIELIIIKPLDVDWMIMGWDNTVCKPTG
jgi:hypothetical protein